MSRGLVTSFQESSEALWYSETFSCFLPGCFLVPFCSISVRVPVENRSVMLLLRVESASDTAPCNSIVYWWLEYFESFDMA